MASSPLRQRGGGPGARSYNPVTSREPPEFVECKSWPSFMLYVYLGVQVAIVFGSFVSLLGNQKIPPRLFFGVLVVGLQSMSFIYYIIALYGGTEHRCYYPRVQWQLVTFVVSGTVALLSTASTGAYYVILHGNKASLLPFDTPDDAGTVFFIAHTLCTVFGLAMIWIAIGTVYIYVLGTAKTKVVAVPYF